MTTTTSKTVHCPCRASLRVRGNAMSDSIQRRTCPSCKREWWLVVHAIEHNGLRLVDFYPHEIGAIRGWQPLHVRMTTRTRG